MSRKKTQPGSLEHKNPRQEDKQKWTQPQDSVNQPCFMLTNALYTSSVFVWETKEKRHLKAFTDGEASKGSCLRKRVGFRPCRGSCRPQLLAEGLFYFLSRNVTENQHESSCSTGRKVLSWTWTQSFYLLRQSSPSEMKLIPCLKLTNLKLTLPYSNSVAVENCNLRHLVWSLGLIWWQTAEGTHYYSETEASSLGRGT